MFTIKGKYATASCYAETINYATINQIREICNQPFAKNQTIAIMPDAHIGQGCTIGTTMTVTDQIVPNLVGSDIGCGMYTVNLGTTPIDLPKLDAICHSIPSGNRIWSTAHTHFNVNQLRCKDTITDDESIQKSLGTLGGGNHFIEVDIATDHTQYLIIHSGSRHLGKHVATYYQNLATQLYERNIDMYTKVPKDLRWLYGSALNDYIHDIQICQQYAKLNRELIAQEICHTLGIKPKDAFHTIHNYIDTNHMILRKGAISAQENELVLIPLNMRDGSILARGLGNPNWNFSAPHGAGRILSRSNAKERLSLEEYQRQMTGIYTTSVRQETIDESPMAYKNAEDIIIPVEETVDIIDIISPIYNFKA